MKATETEKAAARAAASASKPKEQRILDYLFALDQQQATVGDLAIFLNETVETTLRIVSRLEDEGKVAVREDGRYHEGWMVTSTEERSDGFTRFDWESAVETGERAMAIRPEQTHFSIRSPEDTAAIRATGQAQQDAADGEICHQPTAEIEDAAELLRAAVRMLRDLTAPTMPARKRAVERLLDEALAILDRDV